MTQSQWNTQDAKRCVELLQEPARQIMFEAYLDALEANDLSARAVVGHVIRDLQCWHLGSTRKGGHFA